MNIKDKMQKFNQRWNIKDSESQGEKFKKFKTRILSTFSDIERHIYSSDVRTFCKIFGISYEEEYWGYINNALKNTSNPIDIYRILEVIFTFNIYDNDHYATEPHDRQWYLQETQDILGISDMQARIIKSASNEIIFIPIGEKKLDEELVNPVLSFLQPGSNKHLTSALQFYEQKKWVNCAESLRRSLEEYLRGKFKNNAGLQANIIEIGKNLKSQKSPAQIRNIVAITLGHLDQFFNEHSKHKDGDLEESDAEFLIYQIALLMRYIEKYI